MQDTFNLPDGIYLLSHSVGCLPHRAKASLNEHYLEPWQTQGGDAWPHWLHTIEQFNQVIATLINGRHEDVCPQSNLSSGLSKYLQSRFQANHKTKVLMHPASFPSMGFVVSALAPLGFELILLDDDVAEDDVSAWQRALEQHQPDAVLVSHVFSNTGICAPVQDIAAICRAHHAACIVDVAQSAGIVPVDVAAWQADLVLGSCVKWLCGGPGAGFMWVNPASLGELEPVDVGWFSHENPFEFDIRSFRYQHDAKRFWGGTPSVAPYAIAAGSVSQMLELGIDSIRRHNQTLQRVVLDAVSPLLTRQIEQARIGGTLCLSFEPEKCDQVASALNALNCRFDQRGNTFRLSLHIYNSVEEAQKLASVFS